MSKPSSTGCRSATAQQRAVARLVVVARAVLDGADVGLLFVALHHLGRLLGACPRRTGLLVAKAGMHRSWLVKLAEEQPDGGARPPDGSKTDFDVPKLREHRQLALTRCRRSGGGRPARGSYLLLAGGHARDVDVVSELSRDAAPADPVHVLVGAEHQRLARVGQTVTSWSPSDERPAFRRASAGPVERPPDRRADVAFAVYSEIGSQVRALTDVRFKLLALVPPVSALALVGIVSREGPFRGASPGLRAGAALIGFVVVLMIRVYDLRNSQLYDDLISRGRSLESEMQVEYGVYNRRRKAVWPIEHDIALRCLYAAVLVAWSAAAVVAYCVDLTPLPSGGTSGVGE